MLNKTKREELYYKAISFILNEDKEQSFNVLRELLREDSGKHLMGKFEDIEATFNKNK